MVWGKFDDQYPEHPKIQQVGVFGGWLQLKAISYCNRHLTDGFFSYATAEMLIATVASSFYSDGTSWSPAASSGRVTKRAADFDWRRLMVEARLWDPVPDRGGYLIHDYPDYNPSREAVLAEREAAKSRKERWRERHPERRPNSVPDGVRNGKTSTERTAEELGSERREYGFPVLSPIPNTPTPTPSPSTGKGGDGELPSEAAEPVSCVYCGANEQQTGSAHEWDHVTPRHAGGGDDGLNRVLACHPCNQAKKGRIFESIQEARAWLHRAFWSGNRGRWIAHRAYAFGGRPPTDLQSGTRDTDVGRGAPEPTIRTESEKIAKMRELTASGISEKDANYRFGKWLTGQEEAS